MFRITELHAFLAVDETDQEGVCAFHSGESWVPMISADPTRLAQLRPIAMTLAAESGKPIHEVRFTQREDLATIEPPSV